MSYLLDKKLKRKKYTTAVVFAIVFVILFYFRASVFYGISYSSNIIFRPFLSLKNSTGDTVDNVFSYFVSKNSLTKEIEDLRSKLVDDELRMANYSSVLAENESLKEILGRKDIKQDEKNSMTLAVVLAKPSQSPYDTIVIDVGDAQGINVGAKVFASGNIPIGRVSSTFKNSSKVVLFSSPKETTSVMLKETLFDLVGRGGGNFELILPRDFTIEAGEQAVLPGIVPRVVGVVETIISDPRDAFKKALLVSPVNIQELKFVEVER